MNSLVDERAVAVYLNVSIAALRRWRAAGRGPRFLKVGTCVRYRPEDVQQWLASRPTAGGGRMRKVIRPSGSTAKEATFLWEPGVVIVELVCTEEGDLRYAVRRGEATTYTDEYESNKPVPWLKGIVQSGTLQLPSTVQDYGGIDALTAEMRAWIHRYFDCSPGFEAVATVFAMATWVYEQCSAFPYLRFIGLPSSGKSRGSETIGSICYRPLSVAGAASPASLFRLIEVIGGTLILDEADFERTQIGSDIAKLLNCGYEKGRPVIRVEKSGNGPFEPRPYEVYGPKVISGRKRFSDDATESRCLTYVPTSTDRADIPTQLPSSFEAEAREIRNKALAFRLATLETFTVAEERIEGLGSRTTQILLPLLAVANRMGVSGREHYRAALIELARQRDVQEQHERRESLEAKLVEAYISLSRVRPPTCKEVADEARRAGKCDERDGLTASKVSTSLRGIGFETRHTNKGSEVSIKPGTLAALRKRFGLEDAA